MMNILTVNLFFSTLVFSIAARLYLEPRLHQLPPRVVLLPILLLHSLRHLGLMFLAPGAIYAGIPGAFAIPAATGDLAAALLALAAIPAVAANARLAKPLVWVFTVAGSVDLVAAITLATIFDAAAHMGPAYWIPALWVPALLVTHWITFTVLVRHWPRERPAHYGNMGAAAIGYWKYRQALALRLNDPPRPSPALRRAMREPRLRQGTSLGGVTFLSMTETGVSASAFVASASRAAKADFSAESPRAARSRTAARYLPSSRSGPVGSDGEAGPRAGVARSA